MWLEDDSESRVNSIMSVGEDEPEFEAIVRGTSCLNNDDHYTIVDFESSHKVDIVVYNYSVGGTYLGLEIINDGPVIEISTFD